MAGRVSVLSARTLEILATYRQPQPTWPNMIQAELHDAETRRGRFRVLIRTDKKYIAFDPAAPTGQGAQGVFDKKEQAVACIEKLSAEASRRGEPNEVERHGWRLNFDDPKNWL